MLDWTSFFQSWAYIGGGSLLGLGGIAAGIWARANLPVVGRFIGPALIAIGAASLGFTGGVLTEKRIGDASVLRAKLEASQAREEELGRQVSASNKITEDARVRAAQADMRAQAADMRADEYERNHPDVPGTADNCLTDGDLLKRLQR